VYIKLFTYIKKN